MTRIAVVAALAAGLFGCYTHSKGLLVTSHLLDEALQSVKNRAAFDFQCDASKVTTELLTADRYEPTGVAAEGCGQRDVYVQLRSGAWVNRATATELWSRVDEAPRTVAE